MQPTNGTEPSEGTPNRGFSVNVAWEQVEAFLALCRKVGVWFSLGRWVRMRDRHVAGKFREGRAVDFRSREDVERVLAHEKALETPVP